MQTDTFARVQCWENDRIDQVINKEAASVDRSTFLATHMPLRNITNLRTPRHLANPGEDGLLQEIMRCATENEHAFVVVEGIPGSGKSHLIRWLKERYASEQDQREGVLFIERAQCSLSSTLEQIIRSGIFDATTMRDQLDQLRGARMALSKEALADTLLDQLRVATHEDQQEEMPRWLSRSNRLDKFLLDYRVRQELMKVGGPIERLVRFLTSGPGTGIHNSEIPHFEEQDFDFKIAVQREIQGYEEARWLAASLSGEDEREKRMELAGYLNRLIRYAIGHATALTGDDFKQMFYDLRRHLHAQGRNLALFIEDITVLTGIDRGLLDVLVTQHRGTEQQELCRLISVIGITDSYFNSQVPDNIKDRITHHLTLSADNATTALSDPDATADLAIRYLNAIRLSAQELDTWFHLGGNPDTLPIACDRCPVQVACHKAFGFYSLNEDNEREQHVGLYPFNRQALWSLYQHIDTTRSRLTQRALLYNVLHYILQSHGTKIKDGDFPPAPRDLGGEFTEFTLKKPLQREIIRQQGGSDAGRITTLITIWGNGTVDAVTDPGGRSLVGDLPGEVFKAFTILPIPGERLSSTPQPLVEPPPPRLQGSRGPSSPTRLPGTPPPSKPGIEAEIFSLPTVLEEEMHKYNEDITQWLNNGSLRYYADYNELLAPFIRTGIDWDFHGISSIQVDELLKARRHLYIEAQVGKVNAAYYLTLRRSPQLASVLTGLVHIKEAGTALNPALLSGYLSNFSLWLRQHEEEIVQFVRRPNHEATDTLPLAHIVVLNCLLLACLQGSLKKRYETTQELFLDLISFCRNTKAASWDEQTTMAQTKHASSWVSLMKRFKSPVVEKLSSACLQLLNCAQGDSNEVRFLDAATGLRILNDFRQRHWRLPDLGFTGMITLGLWDDALSTYQALHKYFAGAIQEEQVFAESRLHKLEAYIVDSSPQEVFNAIDNLLMTARESQRGLSFEQNKRFNEGDLQATITALQDVVHEQNVESQILKISQSGELLIAAQHYADYFQSFQQEVQSLHLQGKKLLAQLREQGGESVAQEQEQVRALYREISDMLASMNTPGGVR